MNICLLSYRGNPYSGGQGIYLKHVADALIKQGHSVHIVVGPPYPEKIPGAVIHRIHNIEYNTRKGLNIVTPDKPFAVLRPLNLYQFLHSRLGAFSEISAFSYRVFWLLRKLHKKYRFDVIHDNQCLGYGLLLLKTLGVPLVATIHHPLHIDMQSAIERAVSFIKKSRFVMFYPLKMQEIVARRLDKIITVSEASKVKINQCMGVPLSKITAVFNGVDLTLFKQLKQIQKQKNSILFVGNSEDGNKGFIYLLKALSLMQSDCSLTVIDGGAPHRTITNRVVKELGLQQKIHFVGKASKQQLLTHYNKARLLVMPSLFEGFGLPAVEAMACGTPVIAAKGGALPEVIADAGMIVPQRDPAALATAIELLLHNDAIWQQLQQRSLQRVQELFTWDAAAQQLVAVYKELLV